MHGRITCYWQVHFTFGATILKLSMETIRTLNRVEDPENAGFLCVEEGLRRGTGEGQVRKTMSVLPKTVMTAMMKRTKLMRMMTTMKRIQRHNNTSQTRQNGYGATLQATFTNPLINRDNQFITGGEFRPRRSVV